MKDTITLTYEQFCKHLYDTWVEAGIASGLDPEEAEDEAIDFILDHKKMNKEADYIPVTIEVDRWSKG